MSNIKVEPYWNVKVRSTSVPLADLVIKVEPYWNVKDSISCSQIRKYL